MDTTQTHAEQAPKMESLKTKTMTRRRFVPLSLFLLACLFQLAASTYPNRNGDFPRDSDEDNSILEEVLKEIGERQEWDKHTSSSSAAAPNNNTTNANIRRLGVSKVRLGRSHRYEFRIRPSRKSPLGHIVFHFPDRVDPNSWSKPHTAKGTPRLLSRLVSGIPPNSSFLPTFRIQGPFHLSARSHHRLSLSLPMNASHFGLKRVIVSQGIVVEVSKTREVSLSQSCCSDPLANGSSGSSCTGKFGGFCPFCPSSCPPLLPINVVGPASLVAYWAWNPDAVIRAAFLSNDTIELLPDKCYSKNGLRLHPQAVHSLSLTVARLERLLRGLASDRFPQSRFLGSVKVDLRASVVVRFVLEVERSISKNESRKVLLAEWRTRPTVEHVWFEVVAKVEAEKLKPIVIKKIRPFVVVDTASWSNLMSNISFTKFPSVLVPPEYLTLDVKW